MDDQRFDRLAKAMAEGVSRRRMLRFLGAGVASAAAGLVGGTRSGLAACNPFNNGSPCDDGNPCTHFTACSNGACSGGLPVSCPFSFCHEPGVCIRSTGCQPGPILPGRCFINGFCYEDGQLNPFNPNPCQACNPSTSQTTFTPRPNGTACNDGNACTQTDTCQNGACVGSNPVVCTASDQCHVPGVCNPATGVCSNPNAPDGTSCDDGNLCTANGTCQSGICTAGQPIPDCCITDSDCDDGNPCTLNTCVGNTCVIEDLADGTSCGNGMVCQSATCVAVPVNGRCPREFPSRCGDFCADLRTDPRNCGRCGTGCSLGLCYAGRCVAACPRGFVASGGTCVRA